MKPHETYDPYELMIIPPNKKAGMIMKEIEKSEPNLNLISDLIVLGANLEFQDEDNSNITLLYIATRNERVDIARMLIDAGADLNMQDIWNRTPLHWAVYYGKVEIVRMLIDAGARKDILDYRDRLPYDLADTEELKNLLKP